MKIGSTIKYTVIPNEPQHGYQYETEICVTPDEIFEAISMLFESGNAKDGNTTFEINDGTTEVSFTLGDFMPTNIIHSLNYKLETELLDDDWGSEKMVDIITNGIEKFIPDEDICITEIEMR
jgi:hypothetical protein